MKIIRKIRIGRDYKENSIHYQIGQEVYGNHVIANILEKDTDYEIYIKKNKEILLWKSFNKNMGISIEYNLDYE